ncbi:hypothetical protein [Luteibaculum oceani]|uniref:PorT family protein n=1 Tax=Luteibaculum oceani TaxID=1294296 RepID=A0A5C6VJ03_9FLAO|nr:hypothetical protein [Luteibaculum oceani]TXC85157.1 hypothetical protein FRX97_00615 [Luteibaculum oceani]
MKNILTLIACILAGAVMAQSKFEVKLDLGLSSGTSTYNVASVNNYGLLPYTVLAQNIREGQEYELDHRVIDKSAIHQPTILISAAIFRGEMVVIKLGAGMGVVNSHYRYQEIKAIPKNSSSEGRYESYWAHYRSMHRVIYVGPEFEGEFMRIAKNKISFNGYAAFRVGIPVQYKNELDEQYMYYPMESTLENSELEISELKNIDMPDPIFVLPELGMRVNWSIYKNYELGIYAGYRLSSQHSNPGIFNSQSGFTGGLALGF